MGERTITQARSCGYNQATGQLGKLRAEVTRGIPGLFPGLWNVVGGQWLVTGEGNRLRQSFLSTQEQAW